jgi:hypothetical protein
MNIDAYGSNTIFPNPADDRIFINKTFRGNLSYKIYNSLGGLLQRGIINSNLEPIDVSELQAGTFFVQLYYRELGHVITDKFQKR